MVLMVIQTIHQILLFIFTDQQKLEHLLLFNGATNWDGTGQIRTIHGGATYMSGTTQDGFEYFDSSGGNMTSSGEVTVYGFKNS